MCLASASSRSKGLEQTVQGYLAYLDDLLSTDIIVQIYSSESKR
jgi:hypothetical protein